MKSGGKSGHRSGTLFDRSNQSRTRVFALFFTVLLVSSVALAPIAAGAPSPQTDSAAVPIDQPGQQSQNLPSAEPSVSSATANTTTSAPGGPLPPRTSFVEARDQLSNLSEVGPENTPHIDRARSQYEWAIAGFADPVHLSNETVLNAAKKGTNALHAAITQSRGNHAASAEQRSRIDNASALAVRGANRTAAWQLRAAERALDAYAPNLDEGTEARLRSRLENAREAIQRGRTTDPNTTREQGQNGEGTSDLARTVKQRANAINQYRISWRHSTAVLETLEDSNTESTLPDTDGDGIADGLEAQLGTNATNPDTDDDNVTDYTETAGGFPIDTDRDGDIDARDMDSDADDVGDVDPHEGTKDTDGDGILNFRDTDDDGDSIPTAIEVEDGFEWAHDVDFDGTPNWVDTDADNDGKPDGTEGRSDADGDNMPDYLDNDRDNDGLPDSYERNVTKTDATANDSDSAVTDRDEAGNDVIDGMEDFDADTLGTYREYTLGTDPFAADTDGDGLPDGFEQRRTAFDPLVPDSNDDGTPDGDADPDGDGLTNVEEYDHRTAYDVPDTDRDGLDDGREVRLGTNPLTPDTDGDGLGDRVELRLGTDPSESDTNADGIPDGNETFETETTDEATNVTVALRGEGAIADHVTITDKPDYFSDLSADKGPTVRVVNQTAFENATVRIPIDDSVSRSDYANLSVYKWNGSVNDTWSPVETTIENGTATATVDSFSYFTVLDTDEWVSATEAPGTSSKPIAFRQRGNFTCQGACNVTNSTTLILGGEPTAQKITIEQGNRSFDVVPMSNGQEITEFYDYGNAQINSPLPIAERDTSQVFFWSGPQGLSLVVLHDKPSDGSGGAVSMDFTGLPTTDGSWLVKDDSSDFVSPTRFDWAWNWRRTDGGVFRGGLTNETVTIDPGFNDEARKNPLSSGTIDDWQALTGQATSPESVALEMNEPITVHVPDSPATDEDDNATAGDTGQASWASTTDGVTEVAVVYQTEQTDVDPSATIVATDETGEEIRKPLNIGTVGTVKEVFNLSSLSGEEIEMRLEADGVNLRAQVVPRRTSFDSDDDGIPNHLERQTWYMTSGPASRFSTDSNDADTDGDGIPDGQEVSFETVDGDHVRPVVRSNPTEVDTDGDGLDDAAEREGWEIRVATSADQAERYADRLQDVETYEDYVDASSVLSTGQVDSDPLRWDTDGDDLDDFEEYTNRSNPQSTDTDGDTIPDYREAGLAGDITIHDHEPPTVEVRSIRTNDVTRTSYNVTYRLSDPSGLGMAYIYKKGTRQYTINAGGDPADPRTEWGYHWAGFSVERDTLEKIHVGAASFVTGASVDIEAHDSHGNRNRRTFSGPDSFGMAADVIQSTPIPGGVGKREAYLLMSFSSGVTTASGTAVMGLADFVLNIRQRTEEMAEFAEYVNDNREVLREIPGLMIDQVQETQNRQNPFRRSESAYTTFSTGWYTGYTVGFVLTEAALGKGIGTVVNRLRHSARLNYAIRAVRSAGRAVDPGISPRVLAIGGRLDRATPDVDVGTGRFSNYLGRQSQTAQYRIARQVDQVTDSTWRKLDDLDVADPATKVARGVRTSGATFRRALGEVSDPAKGVLLRLTDDAATLNRIMKAWEHGQVSTRELGRVLVRYNDLDAADQQAFGRIVRAGGDEAVEGATKLDDAGFQAVMQADVDAGARAKNFRHYAELDDAQRGTFEKLLRDDSLAGSWIRSVGADGTDLQGTRVALRRADEIDDAHTLQEFESAEQANNRYIRRNGPDASGPHRDGGIVMTYETREIQTLYRLWDEDAPDNSMFGEFTTTDDVIAEADSFADLTDDLAAPAHLEYDSIARVDVPAGTELRYSTAGPNFDRTGGSAQMQLVEKLDAKHWTELDGLPSV